MLSKMITRSMAVVLGGWLTTVSLWAADPIAIPTLEAVPNLAPLDAKLGRNTLTQTTPAAVLCATLSPDEQTLAAGFADQKVRVWTLADNKLIEGVGHKGPVSAVTFNPQGTQFLTAGFDQTLQIWPIPLVDKPTKAFPGHERWVRRVAWLPDGQRFVSAGDDHTVRLWNIAEDKPTLLMGGHTDWVLGLALRREGQWLATAGQDKTIQLWNLSEPATPPRLVATSESPVTDLVWSADGQQLLGSCLDGQVRLWNVADGQLVRALSGHADVVLAVAVHPSGTILATAGADKQIVLWNPTSGEKLHTLTGHTSWVQSLTWSTTGQKLVSASADKTVRVWEFTAP